MSFGIAETADAYSDTIVTVAATSPASICLEEVDGPVRTYREVHDNAWSGSKPALDDLNVQAGDTVLTCLRRPFSVELWRRIPFVVAIEVSANPAYRHSWITSSATALELRSSTTGTSRRLAIPGGEPSVDPALAKDVSKDRRSPKRPPG